MKNLFITVSVILLVSNAHQAYAMKSQEFINMLANRVFSDCKDVDVHLKDGFVEDSTTGSHITEIKNSLDYIMYILKILTSGEPYQRYVRTVDSDVSLGVLKDAEGVLVCGKHKLDINYDDYYWDGVKLELPKQFNVNQNIGNGGKGTIGGDIVDVTNESNYSKIIGNNSSAVSGTGNNNAQSNLFFKIMTNFYYNLTVTLVLIFRLICNPLKKIWNKFFQRKKNK